MRVARKTRRVARVALAAVAALVYIRPAAATLFWDADLNAGNNSGVDGSGLGGSGTWDNLTTANWWNGGSDIAWNDANNDAAIFFGSPGTVAVAGTRTVSALTFKTGGYLISGGTLTRSSSLGIETETGTTTIGSVIAAAGLIKSGAGTLVLTASNTYSGATTVTAGTLRYASDAALGALPADNTVANSGVVLNGSTLMYDGDVTFPVNRRIDIGASGGTIDTNGHTVIIGPNFGQSGNSPGIFSSANGGLTKAGAGTLIIGKSPANGLTYSYNGLTINAGTVEIFTDQDLGAVPGTTSANLTLNGGTLQFGQNLDISANRGITFGANGGTIDTQGFSTNAGYGSSNGFRGSGALTKIGTGTFYTAANNILSWTGSLVIRQGTFKVFNEGGLASNPATYKSNSIILDGGTFQINSSFGPTHANRGLTVTINNGSFDTNGFVVTWGGGISGGSTVTLDKTGAGTLLLGINSNSTPVYSGAITVDGGTLAAGNGTSNAFGNNAASNTITVNNASSVAGGNGAVIPQNISFTSGISLAGVTGAVNPGPGDICTFTGVISGTGNFTKNNPATGFTTVVLTNTANNWTGTTTVAGNLVIGNTNVIPTTTAVSLGGGNGKQFTVNAPFSQTIGSIASTGQVNVFGTLVVGTNNAASNISVLTGTGAMAKTGAGTFTMTGDNASFSGPWTVNGGVLTGSTAKRFGDDSNSNSLTLASGGTFAPGASFSMARPVVAGGGVVDTQGNIVTFNGGVSGTGGLTKSNAGTLAVSSLSAGDVNVSAGTLRIKTRAATGGNKTTYITALSVDPAAALDLNDNDLVVQYGSGTNPFNEIRDAVFNGYSSAPDPSKTGIISSTGQTAGNTILAVIDNAFVGAGDWPIGSGHTIAANSIIGKYTYFGDMDLSGDVTADDYGILDANLGSTPPPGIAWVSGDADLSGDVTPDDYGILDANFGSGVGNPLAPMGAAVPEPGMFALAIVNLLAIDSRRRRNCRRPSQPG